MHTTGNKKETSSEPDPSTILEKIHLQSYEELLCKINGTPKKHVNEVDV